MTSSTMQKNHYEALLNSLKNNNIGAYVKQNLKNN